MKLQEGVHLHFIPTEKFTTNSIKIRFAAPMKEETVAGRVLVANILEMANADYPRTIDFRRKLAHLYGASFSTSFSRRGEAHLIDLNVSFVKPEYLPEDASLTQEILAVLEAVLFRPLTEKDGFKQQIFEMEKRNLMAYLESEVEDNFYHADLELNALFYQKSDLQIPRVATKTLVEKETAQTVFQAYKNMLQLDKIDIFVAGQFDQVYMEKYFKSLPFSFRNPKLALDYQQEFSKITREKTERKEANQSILELAYHLQVLYTDVNYPELLVFNNLFGSSAHSKLFVHLREKEGLAYTVGSSLHVFSGMMRVYAGIDRKERLRVMKLIRQLLSDMKLGKFTDEDLLLSKKVLTTDAKLAQDRVSTLIEVAYNRSIYGDLVPSYPQWIDAVNSVSREEIMAVAKGIRLQAVYFMEGIQ